jgi:hypothetical protein
MATHRATWGVLDALKSRLELRMAELLGGHPKAAVLGSQELAAGPGGEALGIYLHRISVDQHARNRWLPPAEGRRAPRKELPVNLHVLLIGWSTKTESEIGYVSAAMQVIGGALVLDASHLGAADAGWGEREAVQVVPEDMTTEDLMRMWDSLPGDYRLSSPYLVKTVRLAPDGDTADDPLVRSVVVQLGAGPEGEA